MPDLSIQRKPDESRYCIHCGDSTVFWNGKAGMEKDDEKD